MIWPMMSESSCDEWWRFLLLDCVPFVAFAWALLCCCLSGSSWSCRCGISAIDVRLPDIAFWVFSECCWIGAFAWFFSLCCWARLIYLVQCGSSPERLLFPFALISAPLFVLTFIPVKHSQHRPMHTHTHSIVLFAVDVFIVSLAESTFTNQMQSIQRKTDLGQCYYSCSTFRYCLSGDFYLCNYCRMAQSVSDKLRKINICQRLNASTWPHKTSHWHMSHTNSG